MEKKVSRRDFLKASVAASAILTAGATLSARGAYAKELRLIRLSKPESAHAGALLKILEKRSSSREFAPDPLPVSVLSSLLWAGFGINQPTGNAPPPPQATGRRSIFMSRRRTVFICLMQRGRRCRPISGDDIRALTGRQAYAATAAVNLVYVADMAKVGGATKEDKILLSGADTAFIAENVYLYCAAEGLATVVRANIDRAALAKAMKLRQDQTITLAQCVGYPKKGP